MRSLVLLLGAGIFSIVPGKAKIPGTKLAFPGLKDPKQIDDIVAYFKQLDSTGKKAGIVPAGRKLAKMQPRRSRGNRACRLSEEFYNRWLF